MRQQITQPHNRFEFDGVVSALSPFGKFFVKRVMLCADFVSERLEQATQESFAAATRQHGEASAKGPRRLCEFRMFFAPA